MVAVGLGVGAGVGAGVRWPGGAVRGDPPSEADGDPLGLGDAGVMPQKFELDRPKDREVAFAAHVFANTCQSAKCATSR